MTVYIVRKIVDYEYGYRNIEKIFLDGGSAQNYIESLGNGDQGPVTFYDGSQEMEYIIEPHEVDESISGGSF